MSELQLLIFLFTFGHFVAGGDIDYDIQGNIYAVDRGGNALVKYSATGDSLGSVRGFGAGNLSFDEPVAVAARRGTDVYVADYNNHRIQRFNRTLDYITTISTRNDPDERYRFGYPRDLALTRQGDLLVIDGENRRIIRINPQGKVAGSFGGSEAGGGRLVDPVQIDVDERDNIYVLDRTRLIVYDPLGSYIHDFPFFEGFAPQSFSIDHDTLLALGGDIVILYALATNIYAGNWGLAQPTTSIHLLDGRFIALEQKRAALYRAPIEDETR